MNLLATLQRAATVALRLSVRLAWAMLVAPWVIGALAIAGVRYVRRIAWLVTAVPRAAKDSLPCPRGHASELLGVFECRGCGGLYAGHAFQRCPICGSSAGHVMCEHCGLTVRNPMT